MRPTFGAATMFIGHFALGFAAKRPTLNASLYALIAAAGFPEAIRKKAAAYGLPKNEFSDNGGWQYMTE